MSIEHTTWIEGTNSIAPDDSDEFARVKDWLVEFASDSELWRVAWRLLRTCERMREQLAEMQKDADALADEYKSLEEQVEEEITRAKEIGFEAGKHGSWL